MNLLKTVILKCYQKCSQKRNIKMSQLLSHTLLSKSLKTQKLSRLALFGLASVKADIPSVG